MAAEKERSSRTRICFTEAGARGDVCRPRMRGVWGPHADSKFLVDVEGSKATGQGSHTILCAALMANGALVRSLGDAVQIRQTTTAAQYAAAALPSTARLVSNCHGSHCNVPVVVLVACKIQGRHAGDSCDVWVCIHM